MPLRRAPGGLRTGGFAVAAPRNEGQPFAVERGLAEQPAGTALGLDRRQVAQVGRAFPASRIEAGEQAQDGIGLHPPEPHQAQQPKPLRPAHPVHARLDQVQGRMLGQEGHRAAAMILQRGGDGTAQAARTWRKTVVNLGPGHDGGQMPGLRQPQVHVAVVEEVPEHRIEAPCRAQDRGAVGNIGAHGLRGRTVLPTGEADPVGGHRADLVLGQT